jgi:hypothetical protein
MGHRRGIVAIVGLSSFLLCGATSPSGCTSSDDQIGPSKGEVIGAAVGVGAAIAVGTIVIIEVNKSHHTIKGCVTVGPSGVLVHNQSDQKVYSLTGITADVKVGDIVKVSGKKNKKQKDSAGDEDFAVAKISKDYGPCKTALVAPPGPPAASAAGSGQ